MLACRFQLVIVYFLFFLSALKFNDQSKYEIDTILLLICSFYLAKKQN
jgi:hypothetical protein